MAEARTRPNDRSVKRFLEGVAEERMREDAWVLVGLMSKATKTEPRMWGSSIVGFGSYHYRYASGREGDWPVVGFAPRKQGLVLYIMDGFARYGDLLATLGKHRTSKSCLYVRRLEDVHLPTLRKLVQQSVRHMVAVHGRQPRG